MAALLLVIIEVQRQLVGAGGEHPAVSGEAVTLFRHGIVIADGEILRRQAVLGLQLGDGIRQTRRRCSIRRPPRRGQQQAAQQQAEPAQCLFHGKTILSGLTGVFFPIL